MSEELEGTAVIKEVEAAPAVVEKIVEVEVIVEKIVEVSSGMDLSRAEMKGLLSHLPTHSERAGVESARLKLLAALDK
jgi:hypothetical protein